MRKNTDQKKLRIWILFTQCISSLSVVHTLLKHFLKNFRSKSTQMFYENFRDLQLAHYYHNTTTFLADAEKSHPTNCSNSVILSSALPRKSAYTWNYFEDFPWKDTKKRVTVSRCCLYFSRICKYYQNGFCDVRNTKERIFLPGTWFSTFHISHF